MFKREFKIDNDDNGYGSGSNQEDQEEKKKEMERGITELNRVGYLFIFLFIIPLSLSLLFGITGFVISIITAVIAIIKMK